MGVGGRVECKIDALECWACALVVSGALHAPPLLKLGPFFEVLVLGVGEAICLIARYPAECS
jgi:hypothetical protein